MSTHLVPANRSLQACWKLNITHPERQGGKVIPDPTAQTVCTHLECLQVVCLHQQLFLLSNSQRPLKTLLAQWINGPRCCSAVVNSQMRSRRVLRAISAKHGDDGVLVVDG